MVDSSREAFQKFVAVESGEELIDFSRCKDGSYLPVEVERLWQAWQASRSAAIEECAAIAEKHNDAHIQEPRYLNCGLHIGSRIRALKGEG